MKSPVITLNENVSISDARQRFLEHRFRHFPVINKDKHLLGIISDRDILTEVASLEDKTQQSYNSIVTLLNKPVLTASADTHIREICRVMFSQHVGAIPITDDAGSLLGMVTRSDILRAMIEHEPLDLWI